MAFPLRKGGDSTSLCKALNKAVEELRQDGTLKKISMKYFGTDITGKP